MTKLTDLDATFVRLTDPERGDFQEVEASADAQGVMFDCPKCGAHSIICWSSSRGVPDHVGPKPGRWRLDGTGLHDLTLNEEPGKSRSVLLTAGCKWHGFVTNGDAT